MGRRSGCFASRRSSTASSSSGTPGLIRSAAGLAVQDRVEHGTGRGSGKRTLAGDHLVEHRAEREQVRARVDGLPKRLLGRHVGDGANRRAGTRQLGCGNAEAASRRRIVSGAGWLSLASPKSSTFELPARGHEQVGRLDVAVDDARGGGRRRARSAIWIARSTALASAGAGRAAMQALERSSPCSSSITMNGLPVVLARCRGWCRCAGG